MASVRFFLRVRTELTYQQTTHMSQHFGMMGSYSPSPEEHAILMRHLRAYSKFEPDTPQRADEIAATQSELLPIDLHDWQRREIRQWFDTHYFKDLGVTLPDANPVWDSTYQRDFEQPARLRVTTRKKR
jgi:hypothetical protein